MPDTGCQILEQNKQNHYLSQSPLRSQGKSDHHRLRWITQKSCEAGVPSIFAGTNSERLRGQNKRA
jgi:16S rRNA U1498 N3-methylase RsmE